MSDNDSTETPAFEIDARGSQTALPAAPVPAGAPASASTAPPAPSDGHLVHFYGGEDELVASVTRFFLAGLEGGDPLVVIASRSRTAAIQARVEATGVDLAALREMGRFVVLDASEALTLFMRGPEPDADRFEAAVGKVLASVAAKVAPARVRAYGEMIDLLWQGGNHRGALQLDGMWNRLRARSPFTLLSAYSMASFYRESRGADDVCATPTRVQLPDGALHERLEREIAQREVVERRLRESLDAARAREEELRQSEEQLRDFVENAALGLHRVGPDGTILWANRAELDLLGYEEHEYVGRPIADFHADTETITDILARLTCGEALHNYEARLRAKDGSIRHVLISSNVYAPGGQFIHTRCFTRDITARRRAEDAVRQSQQQLQIVTDALPVLIALVDREQRYRFVNAAYERWFGRPRAELLGKHLDEVLGNDAYRAVLPHVERALSGVAVTYEAEIPYRDGGARCVEATYIPHNRATGAVDGFVALVADVTERKSFDRFRADTAERAEKLLKITTAIAAAVAAEQVYEALVDHVAEAVSASSAGLWLVAEDGLTARLMRSRGYSDGVRQRLEVLSLDTAGASPAVDSIRGGKPIWLPSQAAMFGRYPHLAGVATPGRSYRVACLPLMSNDRVLGTLGITIEDAQEQGPEEQDFLLLVAGYASQAIERLRLLDAERFSRVRADAAVGRLEVLSHASRAFATSALDIDSRLRGVVKELAATLDSCINIGLIEADGCVHLGVVQHPDPRAQEILLTLSPDAPLKVGEGVTGSIAESGESVLIPAIDPDLTASRAPAAYRAFLEQFPVFALMGAALKVQGRVIGTVTASRCREGQTYTEADLRLLEELADRAAVAIENGRLFEETSRARTRAEQLYRFAQAVVAADRVEDVFDAAISSLEAALGVRRAAVLTYDADGVMRFRAWHDLSAAYRGAVEGHSPWPRDAMAPEPVLVPDVEADGSLAGYMNLFRDEGIGALAFIPLVAGGELLGKFMVYHERPHRFTQGEVETARAIANHLASVVTRFAAIAKLEETIRSNELFAGVLAHDLRNPLAAMMNAAQIMLLLREGEKPLDEREARPLGRILVSGQRMVTMIEQLLDFTRARSGGGIEIDLHDTNLADLCHQAIGEIELAHPEWTIHREVVGDQRGAWDSGRLLQVFSNLIANAGQHGTRGTPVRVRLDGTAFDSMTIEVHNEGAIREGQISHLFDPFRTTQVRRDQSRGLGLGLFIVREIVRGHGGAIDVASTEEHGTRFSIRLPRRRSASG